MARYIGMKKWEYDTRRKKEMENLEKKVEDFKYSKTTYMSSAWGYLGYSKTEDEQNQEEIQANALRI